MEKFSLIDYSPQVANVVKRRGLWGAIRIFRNTVSESEQVMKAFFASVVGAVSVAWDSVKSAAKKAVELVSPSALVGGGMLVAGSARAVDFTIDTTSIVGVITAGVTTISSIGIAVLSLVVVIKLFKWVQRVL